MRIDILTLFPEMFPGVLNASILGRAAQSGAVELHLHNIRNWADNKHAKVDDRPFGGGPGMVMMCQPLYDSVMAVEQLDIRPATRILLSPQGQPLDQRRVEELASKPRLLLIAGHYEGIDERVIQELQPLELSIGDYVLSGGELPAMVLIDAVVRLLPGVLGHDESAEQDSFAARNWPHLTGSRRTVSRAGIETGGIGTGGTEIEGGKKGGSDAGGTTLASEHRLLDCPHYTRPRIWRGRAVPDVLLSGDHQAIEEWRRKEMIQRTNARRPDLLKGERH